MLEPGYCRIATDPIAVLEREHDSISAEVAKVRTLTNNYSPPDRACGACRAFLDALFYLDTDTHEHVHKENNILFPRAAQRERELMSRSQAA